MCKTIKQTPEWKMYLNLLKSYRLAINKQDNRAAQRARKKLDAFVLTNILMRNVSQAQKYQSSRQKK